MSDTVDIHRRGLMLVLSSPSGAGKTTISRALLQSEPNLVMSVSATTRPRRPSEQEGVDYFFVDAPRFQQMQARDELLECATVFDYLYGTPARPVRAAIAGGCDVLFDIDWQGTQQLAQKARDDLVSIFVLPPSLQTLHQRLVARAQDSEAVVRRRMAQAGDEISHWAEYDYVLINDDLSRCLAKVQAILAAERLKRIRQEGLLQFVEGLRRPVEFDANRSK